jgi:AraC family transcriptional regulator
MRATTTLPPHAYGRNLAANFGADDAPFMVTRSLQRAELAVTELLVERPPGEVSDPMPRQDAYMICCQLQEREALEYWEEGRPFMMPVLRSGVTTIHDLRRDPAAMIDRPIHTMMWFVPHAVLNAVADEANAPRIDGLRFDPRVAVIDETIQQISLSLLPALRSPERVNRLFADHISLAFAAHAAQTYGGLEVPRRPVKGGLAPWQERRAKEMLVADLTGSTPLAEIAKVCGLSSGHFARAFRRSTGLAPHAWLLRARVERATTLLRQAESSLSEIALACGFADQSHFGRVFTQQTGQSPRVWRRQSIR